MASDWENDDIGYGRPPPWTRFEKGQSGNPKGRPKKQPATEPQRPVLLDSPSDRALRRELDRKIKITDASGTKEETMADAVVRAQVTKAAQGHVPAIRDVRRAQKELEKAEAERARLAAAQAEEEKLASERQREATFKFIQQLKVEKATAWDIAIRDGRAEPDDPWPHPDDISLDPVNRSFSVRGPIAAETVPIYEYFRAERDRYFVETLLSMRLRGAAAKARVRFAAGMLGIYDAQLPKRWAIVVDDFAWFSATYMSMSLKFLREDLAKAERKAELLKPASFTEPVRNSSSYAVINRSMKPFLKRMGYVSLAQFERAFEDSAGNPPWPRNQSKAA